MVIKLMVYLIILNNNYNKINNFNNNYNNYNKIETDYNNKYKFY